MILIITLESARGSYNDSFTSLVHFPVHSRRNGIDLNPQWQSCYEASMRRASAAARLRPTEACLRRAARTVVATDRGWRADLLACPDLVKRSS